MLLFVEKCAVCVVAKRSKSRVMILVKKGMLLQSLKILRFDKKNNKNSLLLLLFVAYCGNLW